MILPKYQVFISSPFMGMEKARQAAQLGVQDCGHFPVALDSFAPKHESDLDVITREVHECHVYILILGPTCGERPAGEERTYTEIEFDLAEGAKRYMLIFPLHRDDVFAQREEMDLPQEDEGLERLYRKARSGKHFYREWRWSSPEEIRRHVSLALAQLPLQDNAPRGLFPEPLLGELVDSVTQNEFVQDMVGAIRSFDKLYKRTKTNVEAKTRAAEFLAQTYHARMESDETKGIFFESGSTATFVANVLPVSLWQRIAFGKGGEPSKRITTNNVLVYLLLWLSKAVPCAHFPWGLPEKTYGASYGPIGALGSREPNFKGRPINQRAREAIESLGASRLALKPENTSVIITAASGLQIGKDHKIVGEDGFEVPDHVRDDVNLCFGPHVGSYQNKILKRYLYQTGIPTVLVIDSSKIDCPIDVRKCHFIFGEDLKWEDVLLDHPLALCVGCPSEELNRLTALFQEAMPGFNLVVSEQTRKYSALIARNAAFEIAFPEQVAPLFPRSDAYDMNHPGEPHPPGKMETAPRLGRTRQRAGVDGKGRGNGPLTVPDPGSPPDGAAASRARPKTG